MHDDVRNRLVQMSADFYRRHAESFDESRRGAWSSWRRVLSEATASGPIGSVLDLGCGNGRFLGFLRDEHKVEGAPGIPNGHPALRYTGIDSSGALIQKARARYPGARFEVESVESIKPGTFDLLVCFGVFHHLPGFDHRQKVMAGLRSHLAPEGVVAISFWQPKLLPGFQRKVCSEHAFSGLEENDFLLGWRGDCAFPRYCHHFDDGEIARLVACSGLPPMSEFQGSSNDATNRYVLLGRAPTDENNPS